MTKQKCVYSTSGRILWCRLGWSRTKYVHLADKTTVVQVPTTRNPLEPAQQSSLINLINPLRDSDEYGVDIFLEVLTFIQQTTNI